MKMHLVPTAFVLFAGPALGCPTAADISKGVALRTGDGNIEVHRTSARPDWIDVNVTFADGERALLEMYHGQYLYRAVPLSDAGVPQMNKQQVFAPLAMIGKWDKPAPNATSTNPEPGGGTATAGALETVRIGDCSFEAFTVEIDFGTSDNYVETYTYLADLGIGLLVKTTMTDSTDTYEYTSIEAVE